MELVGQNDDVHASETIRQRLFIMYVYFFIPLLFIYFLFDCCYSFGRTSEELQEVVEHVGDSQHHLWEQPGGGDLCGAVLYRPHGYDSQRQVRLDHPACNATAMML
jgi:hypothetical protein